MTGATAKGRRQLAAPEAAREDPPAESLYYLYCVLEAGTTGARLLARRRVAGLDPAEPLFPVEAAGLVAAVSRVPAAIFAEAPLNALVADLPRLTPYVLRHEAAVRSLFANGDPIVPMAFGAVYRTEERIGGLLRQRAEAFRQVLDALRGKQEWGVKVFAETARVLAAAEAASDELRRLAAEAAAAGPGRAYLLRKRQGQVLLAEAQRLLRDWLDEVMARLEEASAASRRDELPPCDAAETHLCLKVSCLVEAEHLDRFQVVLAELEPRLTERGLRIEVTGPWAPYSFLGRLDE